VRLTRRQIRKDWSTQSWIPFHSIPAISGCLVFGQERLWPRTTVWSG